MKIREIQRKLMISRFHRSLVCPNYTPNGWWECDVFELTKSGYFKEYEIKLSLSDFRADANKVRRRYNYVDNNFTSTNKHQRLSERDASGPTHFWFVAPEGLIPVDELPDWAGLIEAVPKGQSLYLKLLRTAPRLHMVKANPKIEPHIKTIFYYRFQRLFLFNKIADTEEPLKEE